METLLGVRNIIVSYLNLGRIILSSFCGGVFWACINEKTTVWVDLEYLITEKAKGCDFFFKISLYAAQ